MAHTYALGQARASSGSNPITFSFTVSAGDTVIALLIKGAGGTDRTGGAPTLGPYTFVQRNSTQKAVTTPEASAELWDVLNPEPGIYTLTIPNSGTITLYYTVAKGRSATGASQFRAANGANATAANPSPGAVVPVVNGAFIVAIVASGAQAWGPTAQVGTIIANSDDGAHGGGEQYLLQSTAASVTLGWTNASDDWGAVVAAYEESLGRSVSETARLSESATATLTLLQASASDTLTLADDTPPQAEVIGEGEPGEPPLTVSTSETLHLRDGSSTGETLRLTDGPAVATLTTAGETLTPPLLEETLHLADSVTATLLPLDATVSELLRLSDPLTPPVLIDGAAALNVTVSERLRLIDRPIPGETLRLSDTANATIHDLANVLLVTVSETLRIIDDLFVGELLRLSDHVTAVIGEPPAGETLSRSVTETLRLEDAYLGQTQLISVIHITDTVTAAMGLAATISETLRISDQAQGSVGLEATVSETLRISDVVTPLLTPLLLTVPSETLRLSDLEGFDRQFIDSGALAPPVLNETLRLSESATASLTPLAATASDALRLSDSATATLSPLETTLSELLRLDDLDAVISVGLDATVTETLRLADSLTPPVLEEKGNLSRQVDDERLRLDEAYGGSALLGVIHITDIVTATMDLAVTPPSELLRLAETATATLGLTREVSETLRLADSVTATLFPLQATITETLILDDLEPPGRVIFDAENLVKSMEETTLHLTDTVTASLSPLLLTVPIELLRLGESATATRTPITASATETLRLTDTVTATMDLVATATETLRLSDPTPLLSSGLAAEGIETLRLTDAITATLTPLETTLTEALRLAETAVAARDLAVSPSDTLRISDLATAVLSPLQATISETLRLTDVEGFDRRLVESGTLTPPGLTETLRLTDTVTAVLTPLRATASELLRFSDAAVASIGLEATISETLRLSESAMPAFQLTATISETLRLSETAIAQLALLHATAPSETLRLSEAITATLTLLQASVTDTLPITDGPALATFGLQATPSETLRLSEAITAVLSPLQTTISETLRLGDEIPQLLFIDLADRFAPVEEETLRLSDVVTVTISPLLAQPPLEHVRLDDSEFRASKAELLAEIDLETVHVSDQVTARLGHLEAIVSETVRISDAITGQLTVLQVVVGEIVWLEDAIVARLSAGQGDRIPLPGRLTTVRLPARLTTVRLPANLTTRIRLPGGRLMAAEANFTLHRGDDQVVEVEMELEGSIAGFETQLTARKTLAADDPPAVAVPGTVVDAGSAITKGVIEFLLPQALLLTLEVRGYRYSVKRVNVGQANTMTEGIMTVRSDVAHEM